MPNEPPEIKVITVRLPVDLHERLQKAAKTDRRSFNAEVLVLLERALQQTTTERTTT